MRYIVTRLSSNQCASPQGDDHQFGYGRSDPNEIATMLIIDGFPTSQQLVSFRVGSEEKEGGGRGGSGGGGEGESARMKLERRKSMKKKKITGFVRDRDR